MCHATVTTRKKTLLRALPRPGSDLRRAPDLRKLDNDCATQKDAVEQAACVEEMDGYFIGKVRRGVSRDGAVHMPPFDGILQQEAVWAIKSYLETRREKPL